MYPLHLNYTTTLPSKTITIFMKITIFIIVLGTPCPEKIVLLHFGTVSVRFSVRLSQVGVLLEKL